MTLPTAAGDVRLRRLFFALALLYLLPFWTVRYLPTVDGGCHTYNAWVLRQYANTVQYPLFQRYYEINWRPYPNWIGHGTMALLMFVVPPLIAEKLLVSGYVLLFLGGAWYLVGAVRPGERWLAFLAFPFAYHQLFQFGFYNFSISVALLLFVLGFWWRHRARPGLAFAVKINLLLALLYFSHVLSLALALAAIGVLWLATLRRESWRRHLLHVPILLPQIVLPLWFFLSQGGRRMPSELSLGELLRYFAELRVLLTFSEVQRWGGVALATLFLLLFLATLRRKVLRRPLLEEADAFLLLAFLSFALYLVGPAGMSGGGSIKERLSLYPYLFLIPWLSPGIEGRAKRIGVAALAVAAVLNAGFLVHWYRLRGREVEQYLSVLEGVRPNTRILGLFFQRTRPTEFLSHAMAYKALEKGLIDWDNYEARVTMFQTRFRASVPRVHMARVVLAPNNLRLRANRDRLDAVYTWQMPADALLRKRLRNHYRRVATGFGGELWERGRKVPGIESPHGGASQERRRQADRHRRRR